MAETVTTLDAQEPTNPSDKRLCRSSVESKTTALIVEWVKHAINNQADDDGDEMYSIEEDIDVREQIISMIDAAQEMKKALERVSKRSWDNRNFILETLAKANKAGIE